MSSFPRTATAAVLTVLSLSGCGLCPEPDGLTAATAYGWKSEHPAKNPRYDGPWPLPNEWAERPKLAIFIQGIVEQEGRQALVSKYGFQCKAEPTPDCADCLSCSRTMNWVQNNYFSFVGCIDAGTMSSQIYVGPGSTVRAMTYWRK
jgi:hypothetical protein